MPSSFSGTVVTDRCNSICTSRSRHNYIPLSFLSQKQRAWTVVKPEKIQRNLIIIDKTGHAFRKPVATFKLQSSVKLRIQMSIRQSGKSTRFGLGLKVNTLSGQFHYIRMDPWAHRPVYRGLPAVSWTGWPRRWFLVVVVVVFFLLFFESPSCVPLCWSNMLASSRPACLHNQQKHQQKRQRPLATNPSWNGHSPLHGAHVEKSRLATPWNKFLLVLRRWVPVWAWFLTYAVISTKTAIRWIS